MSQDPPTPQESTDAKSDRPRRSQSSTSPQPPKPSSAPRSNRRERRTSTASKSTSETTQASTKTVNPTRSSSETPSASQVAPASTSKKSGAVGSVVRPIFNVVKKPIVSSKLYTNNKAKLDAGWRRMQPVIKLLGWVGNNLLKPLWNKVVQPLWGKLLGLLRPRLPGPLKALSDRILTVLIIAPLVVLWWLVSSLTSGAPIAQSPAASPVITKPAPAPVVSPPASPVVVAPEVETPAPIPEIPQEPEPPTVEVLSVQNQVAQISETYADLVSTVQADFDANRLMVEISDRWYALTHAEQDAMGLDILQRSNDLDFETLELRDTQGSLVARDPVVGPNIIILQRHQTQESS